MRHSLNRTVFALAVALIAFSACGGEEEAGESDGGTDSGNPKTVEVTAKDFTFIPDKLRLEAGDAFEVEFKNSGDVSHTFTVDEFDVDAELSPREDEVVLVAAPARAGDYSYYCRFHRSQGMEGVITITGEGGAAPPSGNPTPEETQDGYRSY